MSGPRVLRLLALAAAASTTACSPLTEPENPLTTAVSSFEADGILFRASLASAQPSDRTVRVEVVAENRFQQVVETTILGGNCMLRIRLYDAARGRLRWSAFQAIDACQEPARRIELQPGGKEVLTESARVDVDRGTYLVTVTFEYLGGFAPAYVELIAGNVTLP